MGLINRNRASDLRGIVRLAVDATVGVTDLVEKMHHTIGQVHPPVGAARGGDTSGLTGFVYRSIRGTTRLVGKGLDASLVPVSALLPQDVSSITRDSFISAINGVYGDHLVQTNNPLALEMTLRYKGLQLDLDQIDAAQVVSTGKVMLFVHGLCLNDSHWIRDGHNQGEALATGLGYTPIYLSYNTGLAIASNGRALAGVLEHLLRDWPYPVSELVIVGHSMGGLVARSACYQGSKAGHDWLQHLRSMVSIGTPHHGAPLERGGNWLDYAMDLSPYVAPFTRIAKKRSAGITDLRHGNICETTQDVVPLPTGVECYAMAGTLGKKRSRIHQRLIGDGLVPVDSAFGQNKDPACSLAFPESHKWLGFETGHLALLGSAGVYQQLHSWFK